jgi:prepilin-type processing-associated H-X9-DG protein
MKQLCLGVLQMSLDANKPVRLKASFKKSFLAHMNAQSKRLGRGQGNAEALHHCPADKSGRSSSYSFNENLEGIPLQRIKRPAETVLIYEGKNGQLDFRHDGRATIGFADGHVKPIKREHTKFLIWR